MTYKSEEGSGFSSYPGEMTRIGLLASICPGFMLMFKGLIGICAGLIISIILVTVRSSVRYGLKHFFWYRIYCASVFFGIMLCLYSMSKWPEHEKIILFLYIVPSAMAAFMATKKEIKLSRK